MVFYHSNRNTDKGREERFYLAHTPRSQFIIWGDQGRSSGRNHGRAWLAGLLPSFLIQPGSPAQKIEPATLGWAPIHRLSIKKTTTDMPQTKVIKTITQLRLVFQATLHTVKLKVDDAKWNGYNLKMKDGQSKGRSLGCLSQEPR